MDGGTWLLRVRSRRAAHRAFRQPGGGCNVYACVSTMPVTAATVPATAPAAMPAVVVGPAAPDAQAEIYWRPDIGWSGSGIPVAIVIGVTRAGRIDRTAAESTQHAERKYEAFRHAGLGVSHEGWTRVGSEGSARWESVTSRDLSARYYSIGSIGAGRVADAGASRALCVPLDFLFAGPGQFRRICGLDLYLIGPILLRQCLGRCKHLNQKCANGYVARPRKFLRRRAGLLDRGLEWGTSLRCDTPRTFGRCPIPSATIVDDRGHDGRLVRHD